MRRDCAAKPGRRHRAPGSWQKRKTVVNGERGEAGRSDLFDGKTQRDGAWRSTESFRVVDSGFMRQPWPGQGENEVGSGQEKVSQGRSSFHHTWDRAKEGSIRWQWMLLVLCAVAVPRRAVESKVAGAWHVADWPGSRSCECGRSLWEARATGSVAGTHRAIGSSTSVRYGQRNRANER